MKERRHRLKTWPSVWKDVRSGVKTFELRQNDRDFAVGDILELDEFDPGNDDVVVSKYSGRVLEAQVIYVLHGGRFGLPVGMCAMGLSKPTEYRRSEFGPLVFVEQNARAAE